MDWDKSKGWPDIYYLEEERQIRRELLLSNMSSQTGQENDIRMHLWNLRYAPRKQNATQEIDYFVKGLLELITESRITLNFLNKGAEQRRIYRIMEDLGILSTSVFAKESFAYPEQVTELLYKEYVALASYYIHFSSKDSRYSSAFMGSIHLKEDDIIEKLAKDFKDACIITPNMFGLNAEFELFQKGCFDAFEKEFPGKRELLI